MFKQAATISIAIILILTIAWMTTLAGQRVYFPPGALDPGSRWLDSFRNHWYSRQLEAMSEPVLAPNRGFKAYRFTWLRSFHHPVAVRVVEANGKCALHAVELDGDGKVFRGKNLELPVEKCVEVEQLMQTTHFRQLAPHEGTNGRDGAEWIVKGAGNEYKVVTRWSPEPGPIREIGEEFLNLSGWKYPADEVY